MQTKVEISKKESEPSTFDLEQITVWSFPSRGNWATHSGSYRGNWAPQVVKNILLRYSKPNDLILDQMVGSGTTLVECILNNRRAIGVDINPSVIQLAQKNLDFKEAKGREKSVKLKVGDARQLDFISPASV